MSSRYDSIYGPDFEPSVQRIHDLLPDTSEGQGVFALGVYEVRKQGELAEQPTSLLQEAVQRYEMWLESVESGRLQTLTVEDQHSTMLLGILAEVSARREDESAEELAEAELHHSSYGGSE